METIINPFEVWDKLFTLQFTFDHYFVVSDTSENALEEFGQWAKKNAPGYISDFEEYSKLLEEEGETWVDENCYPINGGEFYLNEMPRWIDQSEYTLIDRLNNCITGAMRPVITGPEDVYEITDNNGDVSYHFVNDGFDTCEMLNNDGDTIEVTLRKGVYLAYLDMPGYMDQTEYTMHDTFKEAAQYLIDTYGDDN
jgi:hypothetical protein